MPPFRETELSRWHATHAKPLPYDRARFKYQPGISVDAREDDLTPLTPRDYHPLYNTHWQAERAPIWKTCVIQCFALLWLVPIITLLYLNFTRHIAGASAYCPYGHCLPRVWDSSIPDDQPSAFELPAKFDEDTQRLQQAFQLVSKLIEVWFVLVAGWLLYIYTMFLAGRHHGIPIGHLHLPIDFAEVATLCDPLLWSTLVHVPFRRGPSWSGRRRVFLFVVATLFLCLVCNLMGPAVAVLAIPSLQWIEAAQPSNEVYFTSNAGQPPSPYGYLFADSQCYTPSSDPSEDKRRKDAVIAAFQANNYSCAFPWSRHLQAWVDTSYAVAPQQATSAFTSNSLISVQNATAFTFNATTLRVRGVEGRKITAPIVWVPSRRILNDLSRDLSIVALISSGRTSADLRVKFGLSQADFDSYAPCNNTVQTYLHRNGPILGGLVNAWLGFDNETHWVTTVDESRSLRCFEGYELSNAPLAWDSLEVDMVAGTYTKCVSVGPGWHDGFKVANFSIYGAYSEHLRNYQPDLQFLVYSSGKAAFLPKGKLPEGVPAECLIKNRRIPNQVRCDWDAFWRTGDSPKVKNRSKTLTTIEMISSNNTLYNNATIDSRSDYPFSTTLAIDFVAFEAFADYRLDPSWLNNPLHASEYGIDLPKTSTYDDVKPIAVDPAWVLAAWTANAGQKMDSKFSRRSLVEVFEGFLRDNSDNQTDPALSQNVNIDAVGMMPIIQMLSMIDFNSSSIGPGTRPDARHPKLERFAMIQVYAFGLNSKTAIGSFVTAMLGCVIVLLEVVLGSMDRRRFRSWTQLLVAALEHQYDGEFRGVHNELAVSRVPFRLQHHGGNAGKIKFEKVV